MTKQYDIYINLKLQIIAFLLIFSFSVCALDNIELDDTQLIAPLKSDLLDLSGPDTSLPESSALESSSGDLLNLDSSNIDDIPLDIKIIDNLNLPEASNDPATPTHEDIVGCVKVLTELIDILPILKEPFYLRTHPLLTRNVLDLPLFSLYRFYREDFSLKLDLFYNQTSRMNFFQNRKKISGYIALEDENLISALEGVETRIRRLLSDDAFKLSIPRLLPLFSRIKMQERKAGLMISTFIPFEKLLFEIKTPLFYSERNFFLTEHEIETINRARIPGVHINQRGNGISEFARRYLIADRFSMGDLRFTVSYQFVDKPKLHSFIGLEITAPTHFDFKRGLIGYGFERLGCKPDFDICEIITLAKQGETNKDKLIDMGTNFSLGALYQLSANLLEEPATRHWGIGISTRSEFELCSWAFLRFRTVLEYLTPSLENRYFINMRDNLVFSRRDFDDDDKAEENLAFINKQFIDKLYPEVIETRVCPGFLLKSTSSVNFTRGNWIFSVGSDLWLKQGETLDILRTKCCNSSNIDVEKGIIETIYQSKFFTGITYKKETTNQDFYVSLAADMTTVSKNIGKDFSLLLGLEIYM